MKVVIYGKKVCPFCVRAKDLCTARGIEFEYIDFVESGMTKPELEAIVGKPVSSVPQILIDDVAIGGYTELVSYLNKAQQTEEVSENV